SVLATASSTWVLALIWRPCSSQVYQVTPTPASSATSSRRSPGVRRLEPCGIPKSPGLSRARRAFRNLPSSARRGSYVTKASSHHRICPGPNLSVPGDISGGDLGWSRRAPGELGSREPAGVAGTGSGSRRLARRVPGELGSREPAGVCTAGQRTLAPPPEQQSQAAPERR